jgi:hypothetical protein
MSKRLLLSTVLLIGTVLAGCASNAVRAPGLSEPVSITYMGEEWAVAWNETNARIAKTCGFCQNSLINRDNAIGAIEEVSHCKVVDILSLTAQGTIWHARLSCPKEAPQH